MARGSHFSLGRSVAHLLGGGVGLPEGAKSAPALTSHQLDSLPSGIVTDKKGPPSTASAWHMADARLINLLTCTIPVPLPLETHHRHEPAAGPCYCVPHLQNGENL